MPRTPPRRWIAFRCRAAIAALICGSLVGACGEAPTPHGTDGGGGGGEMHVLELDAGENQPPADVGADEGIDAASAGEDSGPTTPACGEGPKPTLADTAWVVPSKRSVCQQFANKIAYQTCGFHTGIDICTGMNEPIVAMAAGKVVHVGYMWLDGATTGRGPYSVIIEHSPGFYSTYGHNESALVNVGDCVAAGDQIATIGSRGYSSGPHLHFEVLEGATFTGQWETPFENACDHYVDPLDFMEP